MYRLAAFLSAGRGSHTPDVPGFAGTYFVWHRTRFFGNTSPLLTVAVLLGARHRDAASRGIHLYLSVASVCYGVRFRRLCRPSGIEDEAVLPLEWRWVWW